jgi:hypothetical protein
MDTFVDLAITLLVLFVPLYCAYLIVQWLARHTRRAPPVRRDSDTPQD